MAEENFDGQEISDMPENSYEISGMPEDSHPSGMPENSHPSGMPENSHSSDIPDNSHPPEIQGSENDSKDDGGAIDEEKKWPGWPGENVFRMLVPVQKVGSIIGRKGEYIKKTCEETRARIKILDGPPGSTERTVLISAKEEPDAQIPPAMDGLLKVHTRIVDVDTDPAHAPPGAGGIVCTRMLVAATQAGSLIGKQGATIKSIQDGSNCVIRVLGGEHLPVFALPDDSIVEVQGEPVGVHKAIELIATHLRKFLVDRSVVGIFETQMQMAIDRGNHDMPPPQSWGPPPPQSWGPPPPQSWGPPPQGFPMNDGPGYVPDQQYIPPHRQFDNYYPPPADMPPMDKQPPREGPPASYGRDAPMGTQTPMQQPQQSMVTKVTQNIQIPLAYADAVIGTSGANISYMRRASGASIVIQETMGNPSEMTVEIIGSASQVQTAQQLIQNFIAEAASAAAQNAQAAPPPGHGQEYNPYPANHGLGQEYNPYPANHGPGPAAYQSEPPNATGHLPAGDYGSVYGNNYGY